MEEKKIEYVLTLTTEQAREIQDALEAIMRWKLKQPEIMREYLPDRLDWTSGVDFDISLAKRNAATELLKAANDLMCPYSYVNPKEPPLKDDQFHRIYDLFQVIRHAIWEARGDTEHWCVDSNEPFPSGTEPLPKIEWREIIDSSGPEKR